MSLNINSVQIQNSVIAAKRKETSEATKDLSLLKSAAGDLRGQLVKNKGNGVQHTIAKEGTNAASLAAEYQAIGEIYTSTFADLSKDHSPEALDMRALLRTQVNTNQEAQNFWSDESSFQKELGTLVKQNPNAAKNPLFKEYLGLHSGQSRTIDELMAAGSDDPEIRSLSAEAKAEHTATKFQLLHLAKGGDAKDLDFIGEQAKELVANPEFLSSEYKSLTVIHANTLDALKAEKHRDPETKALIKEVKSELVKIDSQTQFWTEQSAFGKGILDSITGPNASNFNKGGENAEKYEALTDRIANGQNTMDELVSEGSNDPRIAKMTEKVQNKLVKDESRLENLVGAEKPITKGDMLPKPITKGDLLIQDTQIQIQNASALSQNMLKNHTTNIEMYERTLNDAFTKGESINKTGPVMQKLNTLNEAQEFWKEESSFNQNLSELIKKNPSIAKDPEFRKLLADNNSQASSFDKALFAESPDDTMGQGTVHLFEDHAATQAKLLHLASGGDKKDLDLVGQTAVQLVAKPKFQAHLAKGDVVRHEIALHKALETTGGMIYQPQAMEQLRVIIDINNQEEKFGKNLTTAISKNADRFSPGSKGDAVLQKLLAEYQNARYSDMRDHNFSGGFRVSPEYTKRLDEAKAKLMAFVG